MLNPKRSNWKDTPQDKLGIFMEVFSHHWGYDKPLNEGNLPEALQLIERLRNKYQARADVVENIRSEGSACWHDVMVLAVEDVVVDESGNVEVI